MNAGLLAAGIILMLIGAAGYLYVQTALSDCQSFMGQLGRLFSSGIEQKCQTANYIQLGGSGLFIIGIGLTIGGAISSGSSSRVKNSDLSCGNCGHHLSENEVTNHLCVKCGSTLCLCHCHRSGYNSCEYCNDQHKS